MNTLTNRRRFLSTSSGAALTPILASLVRAEQTSPPEAAKEGKPTIVRTHELMQREADKHLWTLHQSATSRTNLVQMTGEGVRHLHPDAEHSLYVISGEVKATVGTEEFMLSAGDYISIPPGVPHSYLASKDKPALLISMDAPPYDPAKTIRLKPTEK